MSRLPCSLLVVLPLSFSQAPLAGAGEPLLESPSRAFHTGDQDPAQAYRPNAIVAADLDRDGDADVAIAHEGNWVTPHFCILRNQGDGTYGPPEPYRTSGETEEVVAADLDRDGDQDLVFSQTDHGTTGQSVLVFLNRGDGTFGAEKSYAVGKGPTGLAVLDAENDGDLDIVTANNTWGEGDVTVLDNDGSGRFVKRLDFPVGTDQPYKVEAGDLNGDGFADLAVTVRYGSPAVTLLMNDRTGAFGSPVGYQSTYPYLIEQPGLGLGDVDEDGDLDVVYAENEDVSLYETSIALFRNRGDGTLLPPETIPTGGLFGAGHDFAIADVTLDGWPDIVAVASGYLIIPGAGGGRFRDAMRFEAGELPQSVAVADVDRDHDLDVLVADQGSLTVTVHENLGGEFDMPPMYAAGEFGRESAIADIDRDDDLDIVTVDSSIRVLTNDGRAHFTTLEYPLDLGILDYPKLADLDRDGLPDLMMLKNTTIGEPPYDFYVAMNNGDGSFAAPRRYPLGSYGTGDLATLDVDGDGDLDVVITEYLGGPGQDDRKFYLLRNRGDGVFSPPTLIRDSTVTRPYRIVTGDFDGDGHMDVVTGHGYIVVAWLGRGDGTFGGPIPSSMGDGGTVDMVAADLDRDGVLDLATTGYGNTWRGQNVSVLLGYGDGEFTTPDHYYATFSLQYTGTDGIDALDVDQDGALDLVAGVYGAADVSLLLNDGHGQFGPFQRYGVNGRVLSVKAADLDHDGAKDVACNVSTGLFSGTEVAILFGKKALRTTGGMRHMR